MQAEHDQKIYTGVAQIAERLGVSVRAVFRYQDQIPHRRIGNLMVASESALMDWLSGRLIWKPQENNAAPPPSADLPRRRPGRPRKEEQVARRNTTGTGSAS